MRSRHLFPALLLATAAATAQGDVALERTLVDQPGMLVSTYHGMQCGEPVEVRVQAGDPSIYERDSVELQTVIDSVRAVLGFECRLIPAIGVSGTLIGMHEEIYYAVAEPANDWRLAADRDVRVSTPEPTGSPRVDTSVIGAAVPETATYVVAGLSVGMSVEEAINAVEREMEVEPRYNRSSGTLRAHARGCPRDYDWRARQPEPQPGWRCLDARFAGDAHPWLADASLAQVVDRDQRASVIDALTDRYGEPALQYTARSQTRLAWGERLDGTDAPDHDSQALWPLAAEIDATGERTVILLRLTADPASSADEPAYEFRF